MAQQQSQPPVKIRLVWRDDGCEAPPRPKLCFYDSLSSSCSMSALRERVSSKFGACSAVELSMELKSSGTASSTRLVDDADLSRLRADYASACSAGSAQRLTITARPCTPPVQHQHASSGPASLKSVRAATSPASSAKKARGEGEIASGSHGRSGSAPHMSARSDSQAPKHGHPPKAAAHPDVFWDGILRSIVETIDRHHFGHPLNNLKRDTLNTHPLKSNPASSASMA
ncbi:hypothetical protein FOA52_011716 [Chlamydomonas sp. UWO 241]|nr:hypothetical protein FOA52_011716 [Chlamydomonas sp. UWO 241]